uniref:Uncharacterized protein n=1 Tax=Octopus bimaculoides TaxID=37653 RepID=A0A0L8ICB8_OCTBM
MLLYRDGKGGGGFSDSVKTANCMCVRLESSDAIVKSPASMKKLLCEASSQALLQPLKQLLPVSKMLFIR